jgi:predicted type IV restriction endonuclease
MVSGSRPSPPVRPPRIDRELVAFIEVRRVATKLSTRHLRQVEMYAVNEGVEWIILTNGAVWPVYHITGDGTAVSASVPAISVEGGR